jgi:hypothetical protein
MTSDDLHRTNINLLKSDVDYLRALFGFGWTEKVREIVHEYVHYAKEDNGLDAASWYHTPEGREFITRSNDVFDSIKFKKAPK